MIRELVIRNFGAIKSADITLKDYTIFIGKQGSGKSTIAKLITIFEDYTLHKASGTKRDLHALFAEHNIASYFHSDSYISYQWEGSTICYAEEKFEIKILEQQVEKESANNLYIPAERFFVSTFSRSLATLVLYKAPIPVTLLTFASIYEKAKNKYPNYSVPIFDMVLQTGQSYERLYLKEENTSIPFTDASSGIQSVIPLLMVLDYAMEEKEFNRFVIEEPELNLFPETQVSLLHEMVRRCKKLTLTTHSPYLLSAFNNLIAASNALRANPSKSEEVYKLIPKDCVLSFDNVQAFKIENGTVISILDREYQLIVADQIDSVADREGRIFSDLLDLEVQ